MYEFSWYNPEMDVESTMKWMLESTLIKVENLNQSEVRMQADSSKLSC